MLFRFCDLSEKDSFFHKQVFSNIQKTSIHENVSKNVFELAFRRILK